MCVVVLYTSGDYFLLVEISVLVIVFLWFTYCEETRKEDGGLMPRRCVGAIASGDVITSDPTMKPGNTLGNVHRTRSTYETKNTSKTGNIRCGYSHL